MYPHVHSQHFMGLTLFAKCFQHLFEFIKIAISELQNMDI